MRGVLLVAVIVGGACEAPNAPADAPPFVPVDASPDAMRCIDLEEAWYQAVRKLDDSCNDPSDCSLVLDKGDYCECRQVGRAVQTAAYAGSPAEALGVEGEQRCPEFLKACDVAELSAGCSNGHCETLEGEACNPPPR